MNVHRHVKPLVAMLMDELVNTNQRKREEYFNALAFNRRESARMRAGDIQERELQEPEPPMQLLLARPADLEQYLTDMFLGIVRAAENFDNREEGVEAMPGLRAFRLDPQNPNEGLDGMFQRSVMSGNVGTPEIPAPEPASTPVNQPALSVSARAELAKEDAEKSMEGTQRTADRAGTAVADPLTGANVKPSQPEDEEDEDEDGDEPVSRRGERAAAAGGGKKTTGKKAR